MQFKEYGAWALLVVLSAGACAKPGAESQEPTPTEAADGADPEEEPSRGGGRNHRSSRALRI